MSFKVKFWGVRGSIACPSARHIAFGGNTSCIEVAMGGHRVILDAGTGIRNLGHWLLKKDVRVVNLLLTHTHWDHINGFPFFSPAFHKDCTLTVRAGHLIDQDGIESVMAGQMARPNFPVPLELMNAQVRFEDFRAGDAFQLAPDIAIKTIPLNHPDRATGYRLEHCGKALCYITDTEHIPDSPDEKVLGFIEGADLVIYDSTYTDEEFLQRVGWGHSTWQEGIRLCRLAGVKSLAIFHHDPDHEDVFMEKLEGQARVAWDNAIVAREHMRLHLA